MLRTVMGIGTALSLISCSGQAFTTGAGNADHGGTGGAPSAVGSGGARSSNGGSAAPGASGAHAGGATATAGSSSSGGEVGTSGAAATDGGTAVVSADAATSPDTGQETDGACRDTTSNPRHCGACGHDCEQGLCKAGKCQPYELAAVVLPTAIALTGTYVYFTSGEDTTGTVQRVPKTGGASETIAKGQLRPVSLAVDDANVYWANEKGNDVVYCSQATCSPQVVTGGLTTATGVAVDANYVYYTAGGQAGRGMVAGRLKPTGAESFSVQGRGYVTGGVAVGSHFCWTEHDSATFAGVVGCTDVTGASTLSSMAIALPGNPATDGTRIYFTLGSGEVLAASVPLTGTYSNLTGAPKNTQQGRGAVSIAIFDGTAYLAYSTYPLTETGIATCSTNGCFHDGETVLVRDTMPLSAIAVDATGIYWAASGRGVMKMVF